MGEACCMTFRETIGPEAFDLLEAALSEIRLITSCNHAAHEFFLVRIDSPEIAESSHGTAQAIGLFGREFGGDDGELHRLFLKQGNTLGLAQHLEQLVVRAMFRSG